MKGCYSDSWILNSEFFISLFRGLRFKPDVEIGLFGIFEVTSNHLGDPNPNNKQ